MKRIGSLLFAVLLLFSASACAMVDANYRHGMEALKTGNYAKAYDYLKDSDDPRAAEELKRLVFVPVEETSRGSNGKESSRAYTYDDRGHLLRKDENLEGDVRLTEYTYDKQGRLTTVKDSASIQSYTYDEAGNCLTRTTQRDGTVTYKVEYRYDDRNRCVEAVHTHQDGTQTQLELRYDEQDNVVWEKTGNANSWSETHLIYDAAGNCLSRRWIDSNGKETRLTYEYDSAGRLLKETISAGTTLYTYDEAGRLKSREDYDGGRTEYTYDETGNLLTEKRITSDGRESVITNTYDERGNCLTKNYSSGEEYTFSYDDRGNKITEQYTWGDKVFNWTYRWQMCYYPDGVPEPVETLCKETVADRPVV